MPLLNAPPTQAIDAMPIGRPVRPSMAVSAIEESGDVHTIFMMPPRTNPIRIGAWSVAAITESPIVPRMLSTAGALTVRMNLARHAVATAPAIVSMPLGMYFLINTESQ